MTAPRIALVPADIAAPTEVVEPIRRRRGGRLLNLDRALLHSAPLALAWNGYLGAIRTGLAVDAFHRELAICAVGVATGSEYELSQHLPELRAAGASEAQLAALRDLARASADDLLFAASHRAVLRLATGLTRDVKVDEATWAEVCRHFPDARLQTELVAIVATYNMVARFLEGVAVPPEGA